MKKFFGISILLLGLVSPGYGQGLVFKGIGGGLGFIAASMDNGNGSSTSLSGFLLAAHADLGEIAKDISLIPDITYWGTKKNSLKLSDFGVNANAHYNIVARGPFKPYVGAGLGYNSLRSELTLGGVIAGGGTASSSVSRLGINLLAGGNYKLNEMWTFIIEPRYVLASDFNHFAVKAGLTYALN